MRRNRPAAAKLVTALAVAVCLLVEASTVTADSFAWHDHEKHGRQHAVLSAPNRAASGLPTANRLRPHSRTPKKTTIALHGAPETVPVLLEARGTYLCSVHSIGTLCSRKGLGRSPPLA